MMSVLAALDVTNMVAKVVLTAATFGWVAGAHYSVHVCGDFTGFESWHGDLGELGSILDGTATAAGTLSPSWSQDLLPQFSARGVAP